MKKVLLIFAATTCLFTANAQQRTVLYQEFTGENCGPCAAYNPALEALMAANPTKIIHLTNMEPVPSTGFFYMSQQTINDACMGYYGPTWTSFGGSEYTPFGFMDGFLPDSSTPGGIPCGNCGNIHSFVQTDIDKEYAVASPMTITAYHYFSAAHDSVYGKVVIKGVSPIGGAQLKMRVAYVKTMNFATAPGSNGESHFENVVRAMFPNQSGQPVATSWATGTTNSYTYAGKIAGTEGTMAGVTIVDSNFVIWIQNDSTAGTNKYVLNAAKSVYSPSFHALDVNAVTEPVRMNIYPNPAKGLTNVSFSLQESSDVHVKLIDELGRTVSNISKTMSAGAQTIEVPTSQLPAGLYMVQLRVNSDIVTQKLEVIK